VNFNFRVDKDMSGIVNALQTRMASPESERSGVGLYLDIPLTTTVRNDSVAPLSLKNVMGTISYNGDTILQSKADSPVLENIKVEAKSSQPITDSFQVLINKSSIKFFTELVKGNKPLIDYKIKATMFGVPYAFNKSAIINEEKSLKEEPTQK